MTPADDLKRLLCEDGSIDPDLVWTPYRDHAIIAGVVLATAHRSGFDLRRTRWHLAAKGSAHAHADTTEAAADLIPKMLAEVTGA